MCESQEDLRMIHFCIIMLIGFFNFVASFLHVLFFKVCDLLTLRRTGATGIAYSCITCRFCLQGNEALAEQSLGLSGTWLQNVPRGSASRVALVASRATAVQ